MKRSCIPLFVMSMISFLLSALAAVSYRSLVNDRSRLGDIERTAENAIALDLSKVAVEVDMFFLSVILAAAFILGILGLIGCIKKGRFSIACIVISSLPLAYILFAVIDLLMKKNDLVELYLPVLLYLALYMAGAAIAFKGRKTDTPKYEIKILRPSERG